ncbi:MAG TPA: hypothetical protein VG166_01680 [Caulobacteraceae bacterium]|jgi:hypothetical protein|nr:hypothetical protein [Caulobacteraceae bacterium]
MDQDAFRDRLLPGERLVWSGRPGQGIVFTGRDLFLVPFSILWCGFAVFWTVMASGDHAPQFFPLFGLLFVCVGLYFVAGRFVFDAWVRRGMSYALTDRRILILRSPPFNNFTALNLDRLPDAQLSESAGGRGTIRFGQRASAFGRQGMSYWSPALDPTPQFLAIDDVRSVFDKIQRSAQSRP